MGLEVWSCLQWGWTLPQPGWFWLQKQILQKCQLPALQNSRPVLRMNSWGESGFFCKTESSNETNCFVIGLSQAKKKPSHIKANGFSPQNSHPLPSRYWIADGVVPLPAGCLMKKEKGPTPLASPHPQHWWCPFLCSLRFTLSGGKSILNKGRRFEVSIQFSSVAQSCPTLCSPMNHSTPGLPVHHQLPESTQTHVHWVDDAMQPSHPLLSPSPPAFNLSQHQGLFKWVSSSHQVTKLLEFQLQHQSFRYDLNQNP